MSTADAAALGTRTHPAPGTVPTLVEDAIASLMLLVMVVLPLAEIVARRFAGGGIPGSTATVQHLTLWVGFLGAAIAAREGKLLALATGTFMPEGRAGESRASSLPP